MTRYLLPTAILDVFTMQLPFVLITLWFSSETTGQYRMAYQLLFLPSSLVGAAVSQVFFQRMSSIWPDIVAAKVLLIRTWKILALVGLLPLLVVALFGKKLFIFILGENWGEAGLIAVILAPMIFASLIHSPTSVSFIVMGYERLYIYYGIATLLYRSLTLYFGYQLGSIYIGIALFVFFEIVQIMFFNFSLVRKINFLDLSYKGKNNEF